MLDGVVRRVRRLVAADVRLALQMRDDGIEHGLRHQPRARVVEMQHLRAARRLRPRPVKVE